MTRARLYLNENNGSITCAAHGGSYLKSAIAVRPRAAKHVTPLGTWYKLTPSEKADFQYTTGLPAKCGTCQ